MSAVSLRELLSSIDTRLAESNRKLEEVNALVVALSSMTSRLADGRTLVNAVGAILQEVQK